MTNCWLGAKRPLRPRRLDAESGGGVTAEVIPAADFTPHHDLRHLGVYLWNEKVLSNCSARPAEFLRTSATARTRRTVTASTSAASKASIRSRSKSAIIDGKALPVIKTIANANE
jgi:hypothetical protein